jgi:hypothetical protein
VWACVLGTGRCDKIVRRLRTTFKVSTIALISFCLALLPSPSVAKKLSPERYPVISGDVVEMTAQIIATLSKTTGEKNINTAPLYYPSNVKTGPLGMFRSTVNSANTSLFVIIRENDNASLTVTLTDVEFEKIATPQNIFVHGLQFVRPIPVRELTRSSEVMPRTWTRSCNPVGCHMIPMGGNTVWTVRREAEIPLDILRTFVGAAGKPEDRLIFAMSDIPKRANNLGDPNAMLFRSQALALLDAIRQTSINRVSP